MTPLPAPPNSVRKRKSSSQGSAVGKAKRSRFSCSMLHGLKAFVKRIPGLRNKQPTASPTTSFTSSSASRVKKRISSIFFPPAKTLDLVAPPGASHSPTEAPRLPKLASEPRISLFGGDVPELDADLEDTQDPNDIHVVKDDQDWDGGEEGEDAPQDEHDRRDFKAIRAIPNSKIENAVLGMLNLLDKPEKSICRITGRTAGSFHLVVKLSVTAPGEPSKDVILKIPFHGTPSQWTEYDGLELENEATLMLHIHQKTQVPIPEVLHYSSTCDNAIGAPHILMSKLPGTQAANIWFDKPWKDVEHEKAHLQADSPSETVEKKRTRFLSSLAKHMAELNTLEFNKIGVPAFYTSGLKTGPCIGSNPSYR
jgi:hypothetical protein